MTQEAAAASPTSRDLFDSYRRGGALEEWAGPKFTEWRKATEEKITAAILRESRAPDAIALLRRLAALDESTMTDGVYAFEAGMIAIEARDLFASLDGTTGPTTETARAGAEGE